MYNQRQICSPLVSERDFIISVAGKYIIGETKSQLKKKSEAQNRRTIAK